MNKALIIFKGNYELEQDFASNLETVPFDYIGLNSSACAGCTVNARAARAYMECKNSTNNWQTSTSCAASVLSECSSARVYSLGELLQYC